MACAAIGNTISDVAGALSPPPPSHKAHTRIAVFAVSTMACAATGNTTSAMLRARARLQIDPILLSCSASLPFVIFRPPSLPPSLPPFPPPPLLSGCAPSCDMSRTGVGMGSYVESVARRLGFKEPPLSAEQMALSSCRIASNAGAAFGVALGCLLGMFPLLFYDTHHGLAFRPMVFYLPPSLFFPPSLPGKSACLPASVAPSFARRCSLFPAVSHPASSTL